MLLDHRWSGHPLDERNHRCMSLRHWACFLCCAQGKVTRLSKYIVIRDYWNTICLLAQVNGRGWRGERPWRLCRGGMDYIDSKSTRNPPTNELRNSIEASVASKASRIIVIGAMPTSPRMPSTKAAKPTRTWVPAATMPMERISCWPD